MNPVCVTASKAVLCVGIGSIGGPMAGRIMTQFPKTSVYSRTKETMQKHRDQYDSTLVEDLDDAAAAADAIMLCLPNSSTVGHLLDRWCGKDILKPSSIVLDCTSGTMAMSQTYAKQLSENDGVFYVDCAVSGGPKGATNATLTAFVGGEPAAIDACHDLISTFSNNIVPLGPAGAGHATKSVNNILLAAQNLVASEAMTVLLANGIDVPQALQAINDSSGRSWSTMQRMPDNILAESDYGFSLGLHRKDVEAATTLMNTEKGTMVTPMLTQTRSLMNLAVSELGEDVDHVRVAELISGWNGVKLMGLNNDSENE